MEKNSSVIQKPLIPKKEWEDILEAVKRYNLDSHDKQLCFLLKSINPDSQSRLNYCIWQEIKERVSVYLAYHQQNPFITAPAELFPEGYILGRQKSNGSFIRITDEQLTRHALIISSSGAGKTSLSHLIANQLLAVGRKMVIIDSKEDSQALTALHNDMLIIDADAPLNLLQIPISLTASEFIACFCMCFARAHWGGQNIKSVLSEGLKRLFSNSSTPSMKDLFKIIKLMYNIKDTFSRRDAIQGVLQRLERIEQQYPAMFQCRVGISLHDLFAHSLYLPIKIMDDTQEFLISFLIHLLFHNNRAKKIRDRLDTIIYLDESLLIYSKNQAKIEGLPLLSYLQSMVREFGIAMWVTSTSITLTDELLKANVFLQACMNLSTSKEVEEVSKTFGLNKEQKEYLEKKISRGEVIIKFSDGWKESILTTFPPLPYSKDISFEEYHEAKQRIFRYIPAQQIPFEIHEPKKQSSAEPEKQPEPIEQEPPQIQLKDTEKMLLNSVTKFLKPATEHYQTLKLHPATGTSLKKHLIALDFIHEEKIIVRSGKGSSASVLFPTEKTFLYLGLKKPPGLRGGSGPQHQYLVQTIARLIPEAKLEFKLGTKSMDIFCIYKKDLHKGLLEAINSSIIFYMAEKGKKNPFIFHMEEKFQDSDYLAIEIECSDPSKTAPLNIQKNADAGIAFTLLGIMPGSAKKINPGLTDSLPAPLKERFAVVDVLKFLDKLREVYDRQRTT